MQLTHIINLFPNYENVYKVQQSVIPSFEMSV